jgi:hypothetical protein
MEPIEGQHLGANIDTRPPAQAAKQDVTAHETIAQAGAVNWQEQAPESIRVFGVQDQTGKSDCVAETRRKLKRITAKVNHNIDIDFSSVAFYRKRSNYPGGGMIAANAIQMDADHGMTLDILVPSDIVQSEAQANALVVDPINDGVALAFRTSQTDVIFTPGDIETIAGTIQKTRKGVMVWIYATTAEWGKVVPTVDIPGLTLGDPRTAVVHSITAIEPALYNGVKGFWIDDSAHFGGINRRFVTESFFRARNWFASYPIGLRFEGAVSSKPRHTFTRDLEFKPIPPGATPEQIAAITAPDSEVIAAQDCMKYDGTFPTNVDSTGYFGALTRKAVGDYQIKHGILTAADIDAPGYGRIGPRTRADLNARFSN